MSVAPQEQPRHIPFEREPSGMVRLSEYRPYLVDHPDLVPLFFAGDAPANLNRFVYQHMLFKRDDYSQVKIPWEERDRRWRAICELSYSQIAMRSFMEMKLHFDKEETVAFPPEQTLDPTLLDYFDLDMAAAAAIKIEDIKNPLKEEYPSGYEPPLYVRLLNDEERLGIYEETLERLISDLERPRIVAEDVVTSALVRLARAVKSPTLTQVAQERLQDGYYYPLRVPRPGTLRTLGGRIISASLGLTSLEEVREETQALRLPLHLVESTA